MQDERRQRGLNPLGRMVPGLTQRVFSRYGFAVAAIVTEWRAIVGTPLADHTLPEKLVFPSGARRDGTLYLRVESAWALEIQHLSHRVVERINSHFGFRAVARLTLRHGPVPRRPQPPAPLPEVAPPVVSTGASPDLDAALAALGAAMLRPRR